MCAMIATSKKPPGAAVRAQPARAAMEKRRWCLGWYCTAVEWVEYARSIYLKLGLEKQKQCNLPT